VTVSMWTLEVDVLLKEYWTKTRTYGDESVVRKEALPLEYMVHPHRSLIDSIVHTRVRSGELPLAIASFDWVVYHRDPLVSGIMKRKTWPKFVFCEATSKSLNLLVSELQKLRNYHGETVLVGGADTHLSALIRNSNFTALLDFFKSVKYEAKDAPHDKVVAFPMGLLPHYTQKHGETRIRDAIIHASTREKPFLLLAAWGKIWPHLDKMESRRTADEFLASSEWVKRTTVEAEKWWETLRFYKFMLCPTGNGVQSPKFVEALLTCTIPVVQNESAYYDLFLQGFPIVLVKEWSQINPTFLHRQWEILSPRLEEFRSIFSTRRWFDFVTCQEISDKTP